MGKLSNFQKGLKRFLRHRLGNSIDLHAIDECISIYVDWYNNGKKVSTTVDTILKKGTLEREILDVMLDW